mgnify:CR=1 FL=1
MYCVARVSRRGRAEHAGLHGLYCVKNRVPQRGNSCSPKCGHEQLKKSRKPFQASDLWKVGTTVLSRPILPFSTDNAPA